MEETNFQYYSQSSLLSVSMSQSQLEDDDDGSALDGRLSHSYSQSKSQPWHRRQEFRSQDYHESDQKQRLAPKGHTRASRDHDLASGSASEDDEENVADDYKQEKESEQGIGDQPLDLAPASDEASSDSEDDGDDSEMLSPTEVINRIESLIECIVEALDEQKLPELSTYSSRRHRRSSSSKKTKRIVFHNLQQSRTFANVLLVLSFCHTLLLAQRTTTTREVYYFYVTHFRSQKECDAAIVQAANLLRVPRSSLGLYASPKGWFCGCIQIIQNGRVVLDGQALSSLQGAPITQEWLKPNRDFTIDCQLYPREGEAEQDDASSRSAPRRAKCILVIEKEGVYNRFSEDRLFERFPCILVTGKGFPDIATRSFVHAVHSQLNLPVYGVADCNPFGLLVLQTYQYGSARLGMDGGSRYSVPVHWLGLRPSQVENIRDNHGRQVTLPPAVFQKLTDLDRRRLEQMLDENHRFHANSDPDENRYEELEIMEENGYKLELESLNWLGEHSYLNSRPL
jgi:meiotic recombination protein SPO11